MSEALKRIGPGKARVIVLALLSFLVYANTLGNGFVLDDHVAITDNDLVKRGIPAITDLFTTPYRYGWWGYHGDDLYRPLSLVVFATVYQLAGLNAFVFHLLNVLLFSACVVSLFILLDRLFEWKKTRYVIVASLLFALHPIHTEVVANIKSCDELLCFLFSMLSLIMFMKYADSGKIIWALAGCVCYPLALLSKETATTLAALIPVIFLFYKNGYTRRSWLVMACILFLSAGYLLWRHAILSHYNALHAPVDFIENILAKKDLPGAVKYSTAVLICGYYLKLHFLPFPLICDYSFGTIPYAGPLSPAVILSFLLYAFLCVCAVYRLFKYAKDAYAFGIVFFLVTIFIFTNIPFLVGATMAERFLFFSSAGFCLVVSLLLGEAAKAIEKRIPHRYTLLWMISPICLVYFVMTIDRNADWASNKTLYTHDVAAAPGNCRLNYYMGDMLLDEANNGAGDSNTLPTAIGYLAKATSIYPRYALAENDLGACYFGLRQYDSAGPHYERAYRLEPRSALVIKNLAQLNFTTGQYIRSAGFSKKLLELTPADPEIYKTIGLCYLRAGEYDSVIHTLRTAMAVHPEVDVFCKNMAYTFMKMGAPDSARKYEAIARVKDPEFKL